MTFFAEFDEVDEFSARAVGQPGSRIFYLTTRSAGQRVTVRCEKQQVKAIATYLRHVLSDLPPPDDRPLLSPGDSETVPSDPVFILGPIGLGYDRRNDRLLVQLEEVLADDAADDTDDDEADATVAETDEPDRGHVRFYVTRSQADAFCDNADQIVAAGRPQCRWARQPDRPRRPLLPPHELMADAGLPVEIPATIPADAVARLAGGDVTLLGRMPNASNATFLARIDEPGTAPPAPSGDDAAPAGPAWGLAIYKPLRGERPLWDFPAGLYRREAAAYRLSAATGLDVIPPTVVRDDAPLGVGSLQWFVDADFAEHYFSLAEERPQLHDQLRAMAVFDVIANNTDRKSGHCLFERTTERVWGIDNGLCFSIEARLRTVIWDFAGDGLAPALRAVAAAVGEHVPDDVADLLDEDEVAALQLRVAHLADRGTFPLDRTGRGYPWPLV